MAKHNVQQANLEDTGPWDAAFNQLHAWDPTWAGSAARMTTNPWRSRVLSRRLIELIGIALNAACTNLNPDGTRRHIRAPILLEEAEAAGATLSKKQRSNSNFARPTVMAISPAQYGGLYPSAEQRSLR